MSGLLKLDFKIYLFIFSKYNGTCFSFSLFFTFYFFQGHFFNLKFENSFGKKKSKKSLTIFHEEDFTSDFFKNASRKNVSIKSI